jgi:hypothetical protein
VLSLQHTHKNSSLPHNKFYKPSFLEFLLSCLGITKSLQALKHFLRENFYWKWMTSNLMSCLSWNVILVFFWRLFPINNICYLPSSLSKFLLIRVSAFWLYASITMTLSASLQMYLLPTFWVFAELNLTSTFSAGNPTPVARIFGLFYCFNSSSSVKALLLLQLLIC